MAMGKAEKTPLRKQIRKPQKSDFMAGLVVGIFAAVMVASILIANHIFIG